MSGKSDKKSKKLFDLKESMKDRSKLVLSLYDPLKKVIIDASMFTDNKDSFTKMLNEYSDHIDNCIKKRKEVSLKDVKAYLIIFLALTKIFPSEPPTQFEQNFSRFERFLSPKIPEQIRIFAFEVLMVMFQTKKCTELHEKIIHYIDLNPFSIKILDFPTISSSSDLIFEEMDDETKVSSKKTNIDITRTLLTILLENTFESESKFETLSPLFVQVLLVTYPKSAPEITNKLKTFPQVPSELHYLLWEKGLSNISLSAKAKVLQRYMYFPNLLKIICSETVKLQWFINLVNDPLNHDLIRAINNPQISDSFNDFLLSIIRSTEGIYELTVLVTKHTPITLTVNGESQTKDTVEYVCDFLKCLITPTQSVSVKNALKTTVYNSFIKYYQHASNNEKLPYQYIQRRLTYLVDLVFRTWIAWPPSDNDWEDFQNAFVPLMTINNVINIFQECFSHVTLSLIERTYKVVSDNLQFRRYSENEVEPLSYITGLKPVTSYIKQEELLQSSERWLHIAEVIIYHMLEAEERYGKNNFDLHDTCVPLLLAFASNSYENMCGGICNILCRRAPHYPINVYSVLISFIINGIEFRKPCVLAEMHSLFTTEIPGKTKILFDVVGYLRCLTNEEVSELSESQQLKIVSLLNSLIYVPSQFKSSLIKISDGDSYEYTMALCYSNLFSVLQCDSCQQMLLWGVVVCLIQSSETSRPIEEMRIFSDLVLQKIVHPSENVSVQALRSLRFFARCSTFKPELLNHLTESLMIFISNHSIPDGYLSFAFEILVELLFSPSGVLFNTVSPAMQTLLIRTSDYQSTAINYFTEFIQHHFNHIPPVPCCDDSFTRDVFFIGTTRTNMENNQTLYFIKKDSLISITPGVGCADVNIKRKKQTKLSEEVFEAKAERKEFEQQFHQHGGIFSSIAESFNGFNDTLEGDIVDELRDIQKQTIVLEKEMRKLNDEPVVIQATEKSSDTNWDIIEIIEIITRGGDKLTPLTRGPSLKSYISELDNVPIRRRFTAGLIYVSENNEQSKYSTQPSTQFNEFANSLGYTVTKSGFCGFFPKQSEKAFYYSDETTELSIACSVYLNNQIQETMSFPCIVVWNESECRINTKPYEKTSTIIEIHPRSDGFFVIDIWRQSDPNNNVINYVGPLQQGMVVTKQHLPLLARETCINSCLFACNSFDSPLRKRQQIFEKMSSDNALVKDDLTMLECLHLD
ncbi:Rap-GAP domain-containing protein [Entamoeba marina]